MDKAAKLLPLQWENEAEDWGRVTAGTALALKGRILLHWASPLWNRKNDLQRWQAAYEANKNALDTLALGGYGLAYENNAGSQTNAAASNRAASVRHPAFRQSVRRRTATRCPVPHR